jgi:mercuric ion transport protein
LKLKLTFIDKVGSIGMFITALACPVCWPLFAGIGGALGLGILAPWEGIMMDYVFPPFVLVALIGTVLSYRNHRQLIPLVFGVASASFILFGFYVGWQLILMYIGIFGLLIASVLSYLANKKQAMICES